MSALLPPKRNITTLPSVNISTKPRNNLTLAVSALLEFEVKRALVYTNMDDTKVTDLSLDYLKNGLGFLPNGNEVMSVAHLLANSLHSDIKP